MIIQNVIVCDVNGQKKLDIRIEDGIIVEMDKNISVLDTSKCIDANGLYFMPSLIDTNVRVQDATLNSNNIKNIAKEALRGGVGHLVLNADCNPRIDSEMVLEFAQNTLHELDGAEIELMLNAIKDDGTLSNIAILLKRGAIAPYMSTVAKNDVAIKIAEYCQMYEVTLFCKAEDNSLVKAGVMLDGDVSSRLGLAGIPDLSEVLHVSRMIEIARHFKIKILFKAITSPRSISLITQAKKDGVDVKCEVSLHHLLNSDEACENFNTTAKIDPPLACKTDVELLVLALKNEQIDILTTLHQPSTPLNKEVAFFNSAYGCEAISEALPLYYTKFVESKILTMSDLVKLTVQNSAKVIKMQKGVIEVGQEVDALLFDSNAKTILDNPQSLYNQETLSGKVVMSFQGSKISKF